MPGAKATSLTSMNPTPPRRCTPRRPITRSCCPAWLADAELLRLTLAHTVPADPGLGLSWGLGWGIETVAGGPCLWQWGNNPGFRAFAMASVSSGNGFVLLTNSERGLALAAPLARATVPAAHGVFRSSMLG